MEYNPLISVIIPAYNRAQTLPASISSVLSQTYKAIELWVIDDGSTDSTPSVLNAIRDSRFHYCRYENNRGACYARNYGAERATGSLLAFQDSDDIWHADKLEKQLAHLISTHVEMVFCGMNRISQKGQRFYYPVHGFHPEAALSDMLMENRASTQTLLMQRVVWETLRFDESFRRYQDWDFSIRAAERFSLSYLPEALVDSAVSSGSISASVSSYPALCHLYAKHKLLYQQFPRADAMMNRRMGNRLETEDPSIATEHFLKSYHLSHGGYDLVHWFFCKIRSIIQS